MSVTPKAKAAKEMMANLTLSQISATAVAAREVQRHQTEREKDRHTTYLIRIQEECP